MAWCDPGPCASSASPKTGGNEACWRPSRAESPSLAATALGTLATSTIIIPYYHGLVISILLCSVLSLQERERVEIGLPWKWDRVVRLGVDEVSCPQKLRSVTGCLLCRKQRSSLEI